jgi:excisionase family DNA binding protein
MTDELNGYAAAAKELGVSVRTVRRWVKVKRLPALVLGHRTVRFRQPDIDELKRNRSTIPIEEQIKEFLKEAA